MLIKNQRVYFDAVPCPQPKKDMRRARSLFTEIKFRIYVISFVSEIGATLVKLDKNHDNKCDVSGGVIGCPFKHKKKERLC